MVHDSVFARFELSTIYRLDTCEYNSATAVCAYSAPVPVKYRFNIVKSLYAVPSVAMYPAYTVLLPALIAPAVKLSVFVHVRGIAAVDVVTLIFPLVTVIAFDV